MDPSIIHKELFFDTFNVFWSDTQEVMECLQQLTILLYHRKLKYYYTRICNVVSNIDIIAVTITFKSGFLYLLHIYIPQNISDDDLAQLFEEVESIDFLQTKNDFKYRIEEAFTWQKSINI